MVVVVTIIIIMTTLAVNAFPVARSHQNLVSDTEVIQTQLREAQRRAMNETRDEACGEEKACSDVGIYISEKKLIMFADTNESKEFEDGDYQIKEINLQTTIAEDPTSFVYTSVPPNITLHHNGGSISAGDVAEITLQANGLTRDLMVYTYGQIEAQ